LIDHLTARIERNRQTATAGDDGTLIAAAQRDRRAFAPLYQRYVGPIYRYCFARLEDREAAEDATGEVFMKALSALPNYREGAFVAWLFRVAHNVVIDTYRRTRVGPPFELALAEPDPERTPEERAIARSDNEALWAAIAELSDEQRATIELQLAGWHDSQIAKALERSPAAVRMLRLRALKRLRAMLSIAG
jgi:RNA polymerase sigma-70 factor (ECF subfamily)